MKFSNIHKVITFFALLFASPIFAQETQEKFQDWNVFKVKRGDKIVCYTASIPIKRTGNHNEKGEPFFLVTNIENDADEISTSSGFYYSQKSSVEVSFGSKKFYLFPYKALAWANDKSEDINIIKEMQRHEDLVVTGVTQSGKVANEIYSLIGFKQAYAKMKDICKD